MAGMKHFLIIPFNAGCKDAGWLERRLKLFRNFTIPSIKAQTVQRFTTVVLVDPETPEEIKSELVRELDAILYETESWWAVDRGDDAVEDVNPEFSDFFFSLYDDKDWIITSRVDSDDALANNYIEVTQNLFRSKEEFILYPNGVMWIQDTKESFVKKTVSPPFGSLVENGKVPPKTVFYMSHGHIPKMKPHQSCGPELMWIHTYHGENLATKPRKLDRKLEKHEVQALFTVEESCLR
jgi:hypothetical protein